jgi:ketosteroid isomerase-like protein
MKASSSPLPEPSRRTGTVPARRSSLVDAFNTAWSDHDLDAAIALITDDCLFEATGPAPDGESHRGRDAVRAAWAPIFVDASAQFTTEDAFVAKVRSVQTWRYQWTVATSMAST